MGSEITLSDTIESLKGVGESTSKKLERLNIFYIQDLLHHFPTKYLDFTSPKNISDLKDKEMASFTAEISNIKTFFTKSRRLITQATASDKTGKITLSWFNNPYIKRLINENNIYTIAGKPSYFAGKLTIISPVFEESSSLSLNTKGLVPVYPLTAGITNKWLRGKIFNLLNNENFPDPLEEFLGDIKLFELNIAYKNIHFPSTKPDRWQADKRLSFNEHTKINLRNFIEQKNLGGSLSIKINRELDQQTKKTIPFTLTSDQEKVIEAIYKDLSSKNFSHRLIQGDTGSGKTITLVFAANQCLNNNKSLVIMAPTEILAEQHLSTFMKYSVFDKNVQLITGSTKVSPITSKPMVYIGTHALLNQIPQSIDHPIILIAIDEQHKFGVKQREELYKRTPVPHILNLSATPIPRTVALGLIGDIKISNIRHHPANKIPTKTHIISPQRYQNSTTWISKKLDEGNSLFVVCPNISDHGETTASVEKIYKEYMSKYSSKYPVWQLHGRMKPEEQKEIIEKFKNTTSGILISTSLIEVGIDIPSANIMVIHSAERFGLAQLHQLRGRVGRGGKEGFCFLVPSTDDQTETERLLLLQKYNSGLILAQKDMRLRGSGELFGVKQHGAISTRLKYFWIKKQFTLSKKFSKQLITSDFDKARALLYKLEQS